MKYQGVIGIGCYGKPETLLRVLKRMVKNYIMGSFNGSEQHRHCVQIETIGLLKAIFGGLLEKHQFSESEIIENIRKSGITGFFLSLERRKLNLSVFTRDGQAVNGANLENQTEFKRTNCH